MPGVHEQTPLLGSNQVSANRSKPDVSSPRNESAVDASHLEAQSGKIASDSPEDGPRPKIAASLASVIPVLLLGASA